MYLLSPIENDIYLYNFRIPFTFGTSDSSQPSVTVTIYCSPEVSTQVSGQVGSPLSAIGPNFAGACQVSASAAGYNSPAPISITMKNFTNVINSVDQVDSIPGYGNFTMNTLFPANTFNKTQSDLKFLMSMSVDLQVPEAFYPGIPFNVKAVTNDASLSLPLQLEIACLGSSPYSEAITTNQQRQIIIDIYNTSSCSLQTEPSDLLQASQAFNLSSGNISLALENSIVAQNTYIVATIYTNISVSTTAYLNITCGNTTLKSSNNAVYQYQYYLSYFLPFDYLGPCEAQAFDAQNDAIKSEIVSFTVVIPFQLSVFTVNPTAGTTVKFSIFDASNPSLSTPVTIVLGCNSETVLLTRTSTRVQEIAVGTDAIGDCGLYSYPEDPNYPSSYYYGIVAYQPLTLVSSLTGWKGGSEVPVLISALNSEDNFEVLLLASCSIGTNSGTVVVGQTSSYAIDSAINGVDCVLTVQNLPEYYLPIPETRVNIAMSDALEAQVIRQLNVGNFLQ